MLNGSLETAKEEYMREFPFIRQWVKEGRTSISVQKLDIDVLASTPYLVEGDYLKYYCIGRDGEILIEVECKGKHYEEFSFLRPRTWFGHDLPGETVFESMKRGVRPISEIAYVVAVFSHFPHYTIIIYKVPHGFSSNPDLFIQTQQQEIRNRVRENLKDESEMG